MSGFSTTPSSTPHPLFPEQSKWARTPVTRASVGIAVAQWLQRPIVGASLLLTALTVMLTWPQALHMGSLVSPYPDPRLSIWRLSWLAHALRGGGAHLFDGNIFYPNPGTFAYSDATSAV